MFTGIIKDIGTVVRNDHEQATAVLTIKTKLIQQGAYELGTSIAINGTCLTATDLTADTFTVDVMPETYRRTNLGALTAGATVNLEPALLVKEKLDGHFVLGHVDTTAKLIYRQADQNAIVLTFATPAGYEPYLVEKGSIALDGVSLTLVHADVQTFSVSLIPFTLAHTILESCQVGSRVNVETDILGKYIVKLAQGSVEL